MDHHDVLVVGGGNAGISLSARLLRDGRTDVAVADGRQVHRYRPLLNYVGAGEARMRDLERPMTAVVPDAATRVPDDVASVDTDAGTATTRSGRVLGWSTLVLCPGLEEAWVAVPGLAEAYAEGWAGSTFVAESAARVWPALRDLTRGTVVFTVPPEPAPCGATALKPLMMACDHWRRAGVLDDLDVHLLLPGDEPVGLPRADRILARRLARYGVRVHRHARVTGLDGGRREVRASTAGGDQVWEDVAYAHVVPPYRPPAWLAEAGLAGDDGLVDIDPETLRHRRDPRVWALGDASGATPWSSGGALRKQVDVLASNLADAERGTEPRQRYDGYTVKPITTGRHALLLVEVDREGRPARSVPVPDPAVPRRATWAFDRYGLPVLYFRRILRGKV